MSPCLHRGHLPAQGAALHVCTCWQSKGQGLVEKAALHAFMLATPPGTQTVHFSTQKHPTIWCVAAPSAGPTGLVQGQTAT